MNDDDLLAWVQKQNRDGQDKDKPAEATGTGTSGRSGRGPGGGSGHRRETKAPRRGARDGTNAQDASSAPEMKIRQHALDALDKLDGEEMILTLADKDVLDEGEGVELEAVPPGEAHVKAGRARLAALVRGVGDG